MATTRRRGPFDDLPTVDDVKRKINKRYDELFFTDKEGKRRPHVCTVCDEILLSGTSLNLLCLKQLRKVRDLLLWTSLNQNDRIPAVEEIYQFKQPLPNDVNGNFLKGMALSPRGRFIRKAKSNGSGGFTVCEKCKYSLQKARRKHVPLYAIINQNFAGCAPSCLTELNEVELAFLSPTHTHGYCFSHTGGTQLQLKGTLCFMRVKERRIAQAVSALENLKLTEHVIVLCHGRMTDAQRKRVAQRTTVRTDKLIRAAKWLCQNHKRWENVDYDMIKEELKNKRVIRVDHSQTAESTNATVESEELYTCYYPEGSNTEISGGFDEPGVFAEFVEELQKRNFDVEMKVDLEKQFVKDDDADQLIGSCLLQFPYGRCGIDEHRLKQDGSSSPSTDIPSFLAHLSLLAKNEFQTPMFQLITHSMLSRARLLKMSRFKVKGQKQAKDFADGLSYSDLHDTIEQRKLGNRFGGTRISRNFLSSVEACTRALPHTNEAAKTARSTSESMQHYLGSGSVFLTVTFDDDNNLLMQVLSGDEVDDDDDLNTASDADLRQRKRDRRQIRLKYPGYAALHFEMLLQITVEEVIGWSMKDNEPTGRPGLFGFCEAFALAIEEQGRKTLHGHMTTWIKNYKALQSAIFLLMAVDGKMQNVQYRVTTTDLQLLH